MAVGRPCVGLRFGQFAIPMWQRRRRLLPLPRGEVGAHRYFVQARIATAISQLVW